MSLIQALSRLDPEALTLRNDADDLEVVARGVSLDDPTLPAGASAALDALRAVLDEALATGCARVELAVQGDQCASARWRRSLAEPPKVSDIDAFAAGPAVRVRLRESFGLAVMSDALHRRTPERDALQRAMVAPRVPVESLTPLTPPLASAALVSLPSPLRGALELHAPGTTPAFVRCVEGYAWREEPLWGEHEHRPPVRLWVDARWPADFDRLPELRAMPLAAAWSALSKDAHARFDGWRFGGSSDRSVAMEQQAGWERLRQALLETVAAALLRGGRVELQSAPLDAGFPGADAVRPLLHAYLLGQQGLAARDHAVYDSSITPSAAVELAAATTEPLRFVEGEVKDSGRRAMKVVHAHRSSPVIAAFLTALQAKADDARARHESLLEAWRGDAAVVATCPLEATRRQAAGASVVLAAVAPADEARPVEVIVERGGVFSATRTYGPPLATERQALRAWRILVRIDDDGSLRDDAAIVLALRQLAEQCRGRGAIADALGAQANDAFLVRLRTHLAGVAFALDPAGVLDLGNPVPARGPTYHEEGERVWVGPRHGSALLPGYVLDQRSWISSHFDYSGWRALERTEDLFSVALATLRAQGVVGSDGVDPDEGWAVRVGRDGGMRVETLRGWYFNGWVVARDLEGRKGAEPWKRNLARRLTAVVSWAMGWKDKPPHAWWELWLTLVAVSREAGAATPREALAQIEGVPFVCVLDAANRERAAALSELARPRGPARGWWWRELVPGERWREDEGVFLPDDALTAEVLRGLEERLGLALVKGVVEPAVAGTGPTTWRVTSDNVRAMLTLAASPDLTVFPAEIRAALRAWCSWQHELGDLQEAARAAKFWPTTEGAFVSALDYPPGEVPCVELRGDRNARRHPGRAPCIVLAAEQEESYREVIDPATRGEVIEQESILRSQFEVKLLNRLVGPHARVPSAIGWPARD